MRHVLKTIKGGTNNCSLIIIAIKTLLFNSTRVWKVTKKKTAGLEPHAMLHGIVVQVFPIRPWHNPWCICCLNAQQDQKCDDDYSSWWENGGQTHNTQITTIVVHHLWQKTPMTNTQWGNTSWWRWQTRQEHHIEKWLCACGAYIWPTDNPYWLELYPICFEWKSW